MRIVVLNDRNGIGGDAVVAAGLASAYKSIGHDVLFLVGQRRVRDVDAVLPHPSRFYRMVGRIIPASVRAIHRHIRISSILNSINNFKPDIVHVHNFHQQMEGDGHLLAKIAKRYPVVWTLHDMWALTGGCAHAFDCKKYLQGCSDPCPRRGKGPLIRDLNISDEWKRKRKAFKLYGRRICLVCPSQWLATLAREAVGDMVRVEQVSNGIDMKTFTPIDQSASRKVLCLPHDRHIVMTGAFNLKDEEKGSDKLLSAINALAALQPFLLTVGKSKLGHNYTETMEMGYIKDLRLLAICYSSADVFVLPSLAENQPLVLLEAMACGTPCISFDVGGCKEIVENGRTGFVVPAHDTDALTKAINHFLCLPQTAIERMREACLSKSGAYSMDIAVKKYIELLTEMASLA